VLHGGEGVFEGLPARSPPTRYPQPDSPSANNHCRLAWRFTAWLEDGTIMACSTASIATCRACSFHPESVLTQERPSPAGQFPVARAAGAVTGNAALRSLDRRC